MYDSLSVVLLWLLFSGVGWFEVFVSSIRLWFTFLCFGSKYPMWVSFVWMLVDVKQLKLWNRSLKALL